jgi:DNA-binding PadR family transcriptional regulator
VALSGFGRFSEPALLVLISLLDGPKHGYAIRADLGSLTGRRPGPGTLYGAISRLEARGLIEAEPGAAQGSRRRPYRLTGAGLDEARRELAAMSELMATARRRLRAATV